ncbi:hypothetical protein [Candidatus Amarobacter glycogenicus]|uniref:hypothetical protein n=1 Tax=Candidatus Amarobacter glycogenicus TaxID=3140699 RepID=UPI0031CC9F8B
MPFAVCQLRGGSAVSVRSLTAARNALESPKSKLRSTSQAMLPAPPNAGSPIAVSVCAIPASFDTSRPLWSPSGSSSPAWASARTVTANVPDAATSSVV